MGKKIIWGLLCCSVMLQAADVQEVAITEEGWLHSKQAGRYGDLNRSELAPSTHLLDGAELFATLRGMWIDSHCGDTKQTATAVGGNFGFETPEFYAFSGMVGIQTSQKFWGINPGSPETLHSELYGREGDAFTYLSEAELRYNRGGFSLRAGRMKVETPYADPDDIRMAYNTFEGVAASYAFNETLSAELFYFSRWAGFDSGETQSEFVRLAEDSDGLVAAGLVYAADDDNQASLWFYHVDRQYDLLYAEVVGRTHLAPMTHLEWGVQAAQMRALEGSGVEGSVIGAMGMLHYGNLYGGVAYNRAMVAEGDVVTDGFGGGPYFTSLDEATVAAASELAPGHDLPVYRIGGGISLGWDGEESAHLEAVYGLFDPEGSPASVAETDLMFWMEITSGLRVDAVFASFDARQCDHEDFNDFQRYWIRMEYTF